MFIRTVEKTMNTLLNLPVKQAEDFKTEQKISIMNQNQVSENKITPQCLLVCRCMPQLFGFHHRSVV